MDMTTLSAKVTNSYHVIDLQFLPSDNYNKNCNIHNRKKRHKCASKSRGDKAYSVHPVSKSRGICPSVHPTIDAHACSTPGLVRCKRGLRHCRPFSWSALKRRSVSLASLYRGCGLFSRGVVCLWLWVPPGRTGLGLPLVCLRDQYWVRYSTFYIRLICP